MAARMAIHQMLRVRRHHFSFIRLVNSQTQLTEPEYQPAPRVEKVDSFCEHIKKIRPPVDWDRVKSKFNNISAKGLPFGFEIRVINCILISDPPVSKEVAKSLLDYIDPLSDAIGKNPVFDIHLAALLGLLDSKQHANTIKDIVVYVSEKYSFFSKYKAFTQALVHLASTSKENCEIAAKYRACGKSPAARELSLHCLKHGLHEQALATFAPSSDNELDAQPWIDSFLAFEFKDETIHKFLTMLSNTPSSISPSCSQSLQSLLQKIGYEVVDTTIDDNSICTKCGTQLMSITHEEYAKCIQICKERVLDRGDTFVNSSPQEVDAFLRMIDRARKSGKYYDIVIDGLNVAHISHPFVFSMDPAPRFEGRFVKVVKDRKQLAENFKRIVTNAQKIFPRILVICRNHMRGWPSIRAFLDVMHPHVDVFFLDNISQDDPFIIYAAMQTPHTYVMSNDFYRDHKFKMDDRLFERWLRSRLIRAPSDARSFAIPPKHETRFNHSHDWTRLHIPIGYNNTSFTTWLCCHKK